MWLLYIVLRSRAPIDAQYRSDADECTVVPQCHVRRLSEIPCAVSETPVSTQEVDQYILGLPQPKAATLQTVRESILSFLPAAEQGMRYRMPCFSINGQAVAGIAAFKAHLSYFPHSGSVLGELIEDLGGYQRTAGALRFGVDQPLPRELVGKLISVRLAHLAQR